MIWIWDENINAMRPAIPEDCTAEMAETHGKDPAELAKQVQGGRIGQKKNKQIVRIDAAGGIQVKRVKQLLNKTQSHPPRPLSGRVKNQSELRDLAEVMTILLRSQSDRTERKITNDKRPKREMGKAKEIAQKAFEDHWIGHYMKGGNYGLAFDRDAFEASVKAVLPDIAEEDIDDFIREKESGTFTESELVRILASSGWRSKGPIQ